MNEKNTNKPSTLDEEIDLRELFYVLLKGKWIILSVTAFASIIAIIYSLSLPNIYESRSLLVPVNKSSSISGTLQRYSGIAGLAGINIPSSANDDNSAKAITKIRSLSFFENNILPNIHLPELMAYKAWNSETNTSVLDENIFDYKNNSWVRNYSFPMQQIPSAQESYKVFLRHLSFSEDKKFGFITLSIKHQSPFIAKQWSELVVNEVNSFYRLKDKLESEKTVDYLKNQISISNLTEIKETLAKLVQEETKKLALIEANQFYVFDYIDPPAVMEIKSEPKRSTICIMGALLGILLSIIFVLVRQYAFGDKAL